MNDERLMRVRVTANLTKYILKVWTIQSANYVRTELPVRIAHRLRDLQALPYIVVTQEGVARVHKVRVSEFIALPFAYISSLLALLVGLRKVCMLFSRSVPFTIHPESVTTHKSPTLKKMYDFVNFSKVFYMNS